MLSTITTQRLRLRAFRWGDLDDFYAYASHPEVGPNAGWAPHTSREDSREILRHFIKDGKVYALEEKGSGRVIGSLGVHRDLRRTNSAARMLGYVLGRDWWGKGLMTEAVNAVIEDCFTHPGIGILSVYCYDFNKASARIAEKCGFRLEGVLRKSSQRYDGTVFDDCCYSLTREEFECIRREKTP